MSPDVCSLLPELPLKFLLLEYFSPVLCFGDLELDEDLEYEDELLSRECDEDDDDDIDDDVEDVGEDVAEDDEDDDEVDDSDVGVRGIFLFFPSCFSLLSNCCNFCLVSKAGVSDVSVLVSFLTLSSLSLSSCFIRNKKIITMTAVFYHTQRI